jgi:glycyl-tRNA synthetase
LKFDYKLTYDEKDAVGRRYRRQDAKGTPYCITVDHDSLTDQCVTVRERDTMVQERIPVNALNDYFRPKFSLKTYFSE